MLCFITGYIFDACQILLEGMDATWLLVIAVLLLLVFGFLRFMSASHGTFRKMGIDTPPTSMIFGHFGLAVKYGVFKVQTEFYNKYKNKKVFNTLALYRRT